MNDDPLNKVSEIVNREVEKLAFKLANILQGETQSVIKEKVYATGDLRKSISSDVKRIVDGWMIKVYSNTNYSVFAHEGTRPHWVPIYNLYRWVKIKKLAGRYSLKGSRLGSKRDQYLDDMNLAKQIQRKIAKKGTKGVKFFELALKQAMPLIEKEMRGFNV